MVALAAALREEFPTTTWSLVFGVMSDKDVAAMLASLDGLVGAGHACAAAGTSRALPAADAAQALSTALGVPVTVHDSVAGALDAAAGSGEPVLVTGSLYVAGEARTALGVE
jgi:folylpolyglutamate synthase/dihydropteroate synthase